MLSSDALIDKILALDYVQAFQKAEAKLRAETEIWTAYEEMKRLQKDAVMFQEIGKPQAFKETSRQAQEIEKRLKNHPLVVDYQLKMQDVHDLLNYVTHEIETRFQEKLDEND